MSPLPHSLKIQTRVIGALLMREVITRYGRHNIGVLWLILEPMMFTLGVTTLWKVANLHHLSAIPIEVFAITGYSSVLIWRNATSRCVKAIEPNASLMFHRNVKVIDVFLSRVILEIVGSTASFITLSIGFAFFGLIKWPYDFTTVIAGWILLCWFAIGLGFCVGSISERSESFERMWHIVTYLLFPMSGAGFMLDWVPSNARELLSLLPMIHAVEMIRHGFFGDVVRTHENPSFLIVWNLCLTFVGLALVKECSKRVQPE
jgi:capsular polysaccharide transport system permease protein